MEPVITVATVGRLHLDFGWPADRIGMQSADWAFDFVGYASADHSRMELAGEVKKTEAEIDRLVADLVSHADDRPDAPMSSKPRHLNSFRKWEAPRRERPALFWAVGPDGYGTVLVLKHGGDSPRLHAATERRLHFTAAS